MPWYIVGSLLKPFSKSSQCTILPLDFSDLPNSIIHFSKHDLAKAMRFFCQNSSNILKFWNLVQATTVIVETVIVESTVLVEQKPLTTTQFYLLQTTILVETTVIVEQKLLTVFSTITVVDCTLILQFDFLTLNFSLISTGNPYVAQNLSTDPLRPYP